MTNKIDQEALFERIRELCDGREGRPSGVVELSEDLGWGSTSIYKWKTQKAPYDRMYAVAKVLGVTVEYLVEGE